MFWVMHSGIIAAMATVFGRYAAFFVPMGDRGIRAVAVVGDSRHLGARTTLASSAAARSRPTFTVAQGRGGRAIVVVGFAVGPGCRTTFNRARRRRTTRCAASFLLALVAGLFAFGGWHVVTYTAEETVEPERTIPRALALGIVIVTACYVALNAVYFYVLPLGASRSTRVAADAATRCSAGPAARRSRRW